MKNKTSLLFFFFILFFIMSSCSFVHVTAERDKSVDFKQFKSVEYYGWSEAVGSFVSNNDRRMIERSFADEFKRRDIAVVEENGDLAVSLYMVLDQKMAMSGYKNHFAGGPYDTNHGIGMGYGTDNPAYKSSDFKIQAGTLIVDAFDTKTNKHIWQAIGMGSVHPDPLVREKNIPKTVAEIMKEFPVKRKRRK